MKLFLYLLPLVLLVSCNATVKNSGTVDSTPKKASIGADDTLAYIIDTNVNRKPEIDTIFLGFSFGMTKDEFKKHYQDLIKQKKIVYNPGYSAYKYHMVLTSGKADADIKARYYNGKLYDLILNPFPDPDNPGMVEGSDVFMNLMNIFDDKYKGFERFAVRDTVDSAFNNLHYVHNNLHIFLRTDGAETTIEYINSKVQNIFDHADKAAKRKAEKKEDIEQDKTKKDF